MKAFALIFVLSACSPSPRAQVPHVSWGQTADFSVHGEIGPAGAAGAQGPEGKEALSTTSLNVACGNEALGLDARSGSMNASCVAGSANTSLIIGGSDTGVVGGPLAVASAGAAAMKITSGAATTPALVAENVAAHDALSVIGVADFSGAESLKLPRRWVLGFCNPAPSCKRSVATCAMNEIAFSGNCLTGGAAISASCPSTNGSTCSTTGVGRYWICGVETLSTLTTYAHCLRDQ